MIIEILQIATLIMIVTITIVHVCMFVRSLKHDKEMKRFENELDSHLASMQRAVDISRKQHITLVETKKD